THPLRGITKCWIHPFGQATRVPLLHRENRSLIEIHRERTRVVTIKNRTCPLDSLSLVDTAARIKASCRGAAHRRIEADLQRQHDRVAFNEQQSATLDELPQRGCTVEAHSGPHVVGLIPLVEVWRKS